MGSWPEWFAAVGTAIALLIAALTYSRDAKHRREEQAQRVYSSVLHVAEFERGQSTKLRTPGWMGGVAIHTWNGPNDTDLTFTDRAIEVTIGVHNGSDQLVGPIKAQLNLGDGPWDGAAFHWGAVPPASTSEFTFYIKNPVPGGSPGIGTTVIFRDSGSRWWRRHGAEPVRRVHNDPENSAPTRAELDRANDVCRAFGLTPNPPVKVPLRAQLWRQWRKLRGLTPIP